MAKKTRLLLTVIVLLLFVFSTYASLIPDVQAAEITAQEKGLLISKDVVGLDTAEYAINTKEYPQKSYRGVLPQEVVRFDIESAGSNIEVLHTFVNGKLLKLDVLENEGSPRLTKQVNGVAEMAKEFLNNYQSFSGNSLYEELKSSLMGVDPSSNSTKTFGNIKLEVSTIQNDFIDQQIFRWTYTFNGVEAPDKVVALGYENGFLDFFYDSWDLYKIGSTRFNISEEDAIASAMARARNCSWSIEVDNNTAIVKGYNVTGAMIWENVFRSSLVADKARNSDQLMLYPMRHVWVSLDKFYPGYVYGFNVYVWADTGEIAHIQERICTQDPPVELIATEDDFTVAYLNDSFSSEEANSGSLILLITISVFAAVMLVGSVRRLLARKKGLSMRRFSKIGGIILCLLMLSMLTVTITTASAIYQRGRATIWTSRSTDSFNEQINYPDGSSWRKHYNEVAKQAETSASIRTSFLSNDYYTSNYHGNTYYGNKDHLLAKISQNEALYPRVIVVDFDHGNGITNIDDIPPSEFHYLFEDDYGTYEGDWPPGSGPNEEHAVFDMDIYPRTALGKVFFAFINTCNSANVDDVFEGPYSDYVSKQGVIPGTDRARGMPFAFTHLRPGFDLSTNGYTSTTGDFCYIGFHMGSAALQQTIDGSEQPYCEWVKSFFTNALEYDMSVHDALDAASDVLWPGTNWWQSRLHLGFRAQWPLYSTTIQDWVWEGTGITGDGWMRVYGNGNLHLYQKGGIWHLNGNAADSLHDSHGTIHDASPVSGKFSTALSFDGLNDYVEIPDKSDLDITSEMSIELWFKPTGAGSNPGHVMLARKDEAYAVAYSSDNYGLDLRFGDTWYPDRATGKFTYNNWYHLVVTFSVTENKIRIYKNGNLVDTINHNGQANSQNNYALKFGSYYDGYYFSGIIDEVRIYDYALSDSCIADQAAVASFHFNGGDYAYDSSPYVNTGTLYGAALWDTGLRTSSGFSYGLNFDGADDRVVVDDDPSLWFGTGSFTFSGWIKWDGWVDREAYNRIIEKSNFPSQWWCIDVASDGRVQFESNIGTVPMDWAPPLLEEGEWVHLAVVVDRTNNYVYYYKNGNLHFYPYPLGQYGSPDSNADMILAPYGLFDGTMDEIRIYNRVLSSSEISGYYAANKPNRWLTVNAPYAPWTPVVIAIDDHVQGHTSVTRSVSTGAHTIEVSAWYWLDYHGYYVFDHFSYDGNTDDENPMSLTVNKATTVTAHYVPYG